MKKKSFLKSSIALILVAMLVGSAVGCKGNTDNNESNTGTTQSVTESSTEKVSVNYGLTDSIKDGAILHAWCWSFNTVKENMQDIAYAGYSTIQTSPINECFVGADGGMQISGDGKWYYHYQPTDWTIGNYQLGTKDEFKAMCDEAHKYGIKVIVDVVPNHTTTQVDQVNKNLLDAVGGKENLYHANGFKEITKWGDRFECTTGQMGGLPDVNTENKNFQDYFIKYLNDCIACGADGFRYDTAKHIGLPDDPKDSKATENNFWPRVISEITNADKIFNYGEVLQGDNERIDEYQKVIGATTASAYGATIRSSINSGNLLASKMEDLQIDVDNPTAVTWVESHDNYCSDSSYKTVDDNEVIRAWAIICARKSGTPLFYDRPYGATADNMWGTMNRIGAAGYPFYKDAAVVAVNRFRNAMVGQDEKLLNPDDTKKVLLIERGTKGAVVINGSDEDYKLNVKTSLADGTYIDRADGTTQYTVSGGVLTGTLKAGAVIVLYNDGYIEVPSIASVSLDADNFVLTAGSTETVTLKSENAASATYSIDGGTETSYNNGDKLEIGKDAKAGTAVKITLKANTSAGNGATVMSYYFTVQENRSVKNGTKVYFTKPSNWGNKVYAYIYDERGSKVKEAAAWPGVELKDEGDSKYSYTFTEAWDNALIIFSDGTNQVPAANEPGMLVEPEKTYTTDSASTKTDTGTAGTTDTDTNAEGVTVYFTKPSSWGNTIYAYVYDGGDQVAAWPGTACKDEGNSKYSYTFTKNWKNPLIIFTDGKNQYPAQNEAGLPLESGKTYTAN